MASTTKAVLLLSSLSVVFATGARNYAITDTFIGQNFLTGWQHQAIADPTHGRVNYTDQATAVKLGLTQVSSDSLIMRADSTTVLSATGPGRNSIRLMSNKEYGTSVTVINLRHMPEGCSTWPAFWTTSSTVTWPNDGEIDIIEGVNDDGPNASTLHTTAQCTMTSNTMTQTGDFASGDCFWQDNYNTGCQVKAKASAPSYGPAFNAIGGGWYAMERTDTFINVWFWARNDASVPADVANGYAQVNPAHWGTPYANFVNNNCNIGSHFGPNNIIFDLTLCGDWAGSSGVWPGPACAAKVGSSSCIDWVNNNPSAFTNAYWDVASVRVYEPGCSTTPNTVSKRDLDAHRQHIKDREF